MEIDHKVRARSQAAELWLLRLQRATRLPSSLFGTLAGSITLLLVMLPITISHGWDSASRDVLDGALFFGLTIGILAGFSSPVFRGAVEDLEVLGSVLPCSAAERSLLAQSLVRERNGTALFMAACGLAVGLLHCWLMDTQRMPLPYAASQATGTLLVWLMMWTTIAKLIENASLFSSLGAHAHPDLLRPSRHAAFGRAALRPAMFLIGLLCVYPVLALGGDLSSGTLVGFIATILALFGLFFLPLKGIRRRKREVRRTTLADLDRRVDRLYSGNIATADAERLFELDAVLDIRERVARASAWPLDLDGVRRILLYVVLPPLTWAAAALVEMAVDQML